MADNHITEQVKAWRSRHYLTQAEAAPFLCVSLNTLQAWEQGTGCAYPDLFQRLLRHSPGELSLFLNLTAQPPG